MNTHHQNQNTKTIHQEFSVRFDYPVHFTNDVFDSSNPILNSVLNRKSGDSHKKALVYIDSGIADTHPGIIDKISDYFTHHTQRISLTRAPIVIPGGENCKNGWGPVRDIMTSIGDEHLDRQSFVVAIGGGSLLDMSGFAAALVHRGIRFIRLPSTVLSQNDAGVGVKNGMNERDTKNFLGAFAPPWAVINDFDLLTSLKDKDWRGGISEAFKVAIIKDKTFFDFLFEAGPELKNRNQKAMEKLVYKCADLHLNHIRTSGDPFELGSSRPLDFGHWSAHKLESLSDFTIGHGYAVAMGISLDSVIAVKLGLLSEAECSQILTGFENCGLPTWHNLMERKNSKDEFHIIKGLEEFREHLGGNLTLAMPKGIGEQCEINSLDAVLIEEAISDLKTRFESSENQTP